MESGAIHYQNYLAGTDIAMKELIDEYYDGLALYLNAYVRNLTIAEDLAEDTFAELAIKKPAFKQRSSFKTWLYAIGRNITIDYIRRESKKTTFPIDEYEECIADDKNIENNYIVSEEKTQLHRALSKLKYEYRQVLWLVYFEDMSQKEVASVMKKTTVSVEHLIRRAEAALKAEMEKEGYSYEKA